MDNQSAMAGKIDGMAAGTGGLGGEVAYAFGPAIDVSNAAQAKAQEKATMDRQADGKNDGEKDVTRGTGGQNIKGTVTDYMDETLREMKDANANQGDSIVDPKTLDHGRPSLRPQFVQGGEEQVRKTGAERMEMDVQFDMFDFVPEGHGLGATNKMYVQEKNRERMIRFAEPLAMPAKSDGAENGLHPENDQRLNNEHEAGGGAVIREMRHNVEDAMNMVAAVSALGTKSADSLADDNNRIMSSKGLRARKPSPFNFQIENHSPFLPVFEPAGCNMKRKFRSIFDPMREPMHMKAYNPYNGIPTLSKRRALAINLP